MSRRPGTPAKALFPYLDLIDLVRVMTVETGFGGQSFIETTYSRIETLKAEMERRGIDIPIEVDGGVNPSNVKALAEAGVDIVVGGSAVLGAEDPAAVIKELQEA